MTDLITRAREQVTARPIIFSAPMIRALTFEMIYKNVDKVTA